MKYLKIVNPLIILSKIENEVKENVLYSLICDECTDSTNQEQLSVSVPYVANDRVMESLLCFLSCLME